MIIHIIFFKLISESLLSLYPLLVKKLPLSVMSQMWTRLLTYSLISLFFINWKIVFNWIFKMDGLLLSLTNLVHIFASYMGFKRLDISVSYSIFYTYPIFIMLLVYKKFYWSFLIPFIGVIFLALNTSNPSKIKDKSKEKKETNKKEIKEKIEDRKRYEITVGVLMMILSAITEAGIYYYVHKLNFKNSWNGLFISYFIPFILMSVLLNKEVIEGNKAKGFLLGLLGNAVIGVIGYYLRYKSITNLTTFTYSYLSFFGIIMAYVYGIFFNNENFSWNRIVGTLIIVIYGLFNYSVF